MNPYLQAIQRRLSQGGAGMMHPGININPITNQGLPLQGSQQAAQPLQSPNQIDPGMLHPDANSMIRTMDPRKNTGTSWKQDQIASRLKRIRGGRMRMAGPQ
jgi:hypothetical protein